MEGQQNWSTNVSIRASREQLAPYVQSIEALGPDVSVTVRGPSEVGVCLVVVKAPINQSEDVNEVFGAFNRDFPNSILMDFKE
jgi:hypothetical protein